MLLTALGEAGRLICFVSSTLGYQLTCICSTSGQVVGSASLARLVALVTSYQLCLLIVALT